MNAIKMTKVSMVGLLIVSVLGYMAVGPQEAPYLPLIAWPLAYVAIAYWVGRDSVREDSEFLCLPNAEQEQVRHRAGLRHMPHGVALGFLVAAVVVLIRSLGLYPLSRRWISLLVAGAAGYAMYVYTRHVLKERETGVLVSVILFGGLPIWSQFAVVGDD